MILVTGTLALQPSQEQAALEAVREVRRHTLEEPGCRAYRFAVDVDDRQVLHLHEEWEDEDALQAHLASAHFTDFAERIGDKLAAPPDVVRWDAGAARPLFG